MVLLKWWAMRDFLRFTQDKLTAQRKWQPKRTAMSNTKMVGDARLPSFHSGQAHCAKKMAAQKDCHE